MDATRKEIKKIFKQRIADDQYKINSEIRAVEQMMSCEHKIEFSPILSKMQRFCNTIEENVKKEGVKPIEVPRHILNTNVIEFFEKQNLSFANIPIEPMSEYATKKYCKLFPLT